MILHYPNQHCQCTDKLLNYFVVVGIPLCDVATACIKVDYEATKHELRHVREELNEMTSEVEAVERLKTVAEQNLAEALRMLQQERELRHSIKKELDQRTASESVFGLHSLSLLGLGDAHPHGHQASDAGTAVANSESGLHIHHVSDGDDRNPALKRIEAEFSSQKHELISLAPVPRQGLAGNLFSEVHVGEIRKLERMLEQTEIEKSNVERALEESTERLAEAVAEAAARNADVATLQAQLEQMSANQKTSGEISAADPCIVKKFPNYESAIVELSSLTRDVETLRRSVDQEAQPTTAGSDGTERPAADTVDHYKDMMNKLEVDCADQCQVVDELKCSLAQTKDGLRQICTNLAQLCSSICEQAGETPDKTLLCDIMDYNDKLASDRQSSMPASQDDLVRPDNVSDAASVANRSMNSSGIIDFDSIADGLPAIVCYKLIEVIQKQIRYAGCVFDRLAEKSQSPHQAGAYANVDEVTELQEQVY